MRWSNMSLTIFSDPTFSLKYAGFHVVTTRRNCIVGRPIYAERTLM